MRRENRWWQTLILVQEKQNWADQLWLTTDYFKKITNQHLRMIKEEEDKLCECDRLKKKKTDKRMFDI